MWSHLLAAQKKSGKAEEVSPYPSSTLLSGQSPYHAATFALGSTNWCSTFPRKVMCPGVTVFITIFLYKRGKIFIVTGTWFFPEKCVHRQAMCHKSHKESMSGKARNRSLVISFPIRVCYLPWPVSCGQAAFILVLNVPRSLSENPSEDASHCTMLQPSRTEVCLEFWATRAHLWIKSTSIVEPYNLVSCN